jgi:hypothetical protein
VWEGPQQKAFEEVIEELKSPRVLVSYRPEARLRLETDAAQTRGLGFALWQEEPDGKWRLLRAGSRVMTPTESRYSVTEVELLAVVWAAKKLRLYLRGKPFELVVDHKPLVPILNHKQLEDIATPRILRLKEKLAEFVLTAVWRPGASMTVVDAFSRYPTSAPSASDLEGEEDVEDYAKKFAVNAVVKDQRLEAIKTETKQDPVMVKLTEVVRSGFPQHRAELDEELREYWKVKSELTVVDGMVLYGARRIVVPARLRRSVLEELHAAHLGRQRMLALARESVYWPGITQAIEDTVKRCDECEVNKASQAKEPLLPDEVPTRPGEAIATDLFAFNGKEYLVITDKYSGWPEVYSFPRRGVDTEDVTGMIQRWMATHGVPVRLTSDGGPQFKGEEFATFCRKWAIAHDPSSPYHHIANGHAEAAVKTMKSLLKKTSASGDILDPCFLKGLLTYRNTPREDGMSPAKRLFGRAMRTCCQLTQLCSNR